MKQEPTIRYFDSADGASAFIALHLDNDGVSVEIIGKADGIGLDREDARELAHSILDHLDVLDRKGK